MKRSLWLVLAVLLGVGGTLVALPAGAQSDTPATFVRAVDSRDPENVEMQLVYAGDAIDTVTVESGGTELNTGDPARYIDTNRNVGLALVVDTSATMDDSGALTDVRDSIKAVADSKPENLQIAIVQAGDTPRLLTRFASDADRIKAAADQLVPSPNGGAATWGGIDQAATLMRDKASDLQPNLMVITTGTPSDSADSQDAAISNTAATGAVSWVLGFQGFDTGGFESLVDATGGTITAYDTPSDLGQGIGDESTGVLDTQYVVPYDSTGAESDQGITDITVKVGDESVNASYVDGRLVEGKRELSASTDTSTSGLPVLNTEAGKYLGIVLALIAVAVFIYAIVLLVGRDEGALSNVLQPYADGFTEAEEDEGEGGGGLGSSAIVQRAVAVTENVADSQGYLSRTEASLERADLPLRAGEALLFYVIAVVVVTLGAMFLTRNLLAGLVIGLIVALIPPSYVSFKAGRRRSHFQAQLPDTLQLLAGTLRAGYSLMQGVEAVSQEVEDPMGKELRRVVTESRLGRPLEEALDGMAERMASPDFAWAVMAIRIQREVGGNLSELLMTVAETMIARERLRRDINALTAEGRVSALVLGLLPVGLGLVMYVINPEYIGQLFDTTLGNVLLIAAAIGMLVGFVWMRQIIKIEI